jgi:hypothetical protein
VTLNFQKKKNNELKTKDLLYAAISVGHCSNLAMIVYMIVPDLDLGVLHYQIWEPRGQQSTSLGESFVDSQQIVGQG